MIKNINSKMTTNLQLSTAEPKKPSNKLSKQLEWEQYHRNGDQMEGYQWGRERRVKGEKTQGIRSINGRSKVDKGRLRIV